MVTQIDRPNIKECTSAGIRLTSGLSLQAGCRSGWAACDNSLGSRPLWVCGSLRCTCAKSQWFAQRIQPGLASASQVITAIIAALLTARADSVAGKVAGPHSIITGDNTIVLVVLGLCRSTAHNEQQQAKSEGVHLHANSRNGRCIRQISLAAEELSII
jgi:hypothetical protein